MNGSRPNGFFVSGGTMPLDSKSYIERGSDRELYDGLMAGRYCYVLNSRQMGKSSLSIRVLAKLEQAGVKTTFVDLTRIGGRNVTAGQWYAGLCDAIGTSLGLQSEMLTYFRNHTHLGPMQRFFGALKEVALGSVSGPISVFIDEIDATKNLSFETDEFFAGIRECYNRRVQDPTFDRLTFCLIGVAVPTDLISNPSTTPFNIGERIELNDFTLAEMQALASALGDSGKELIERVHYWTSGQPFLTQSLCEKIVSEGKVKSAADVDQLVQERLLERRARATNINLSDVGERALNAGASETNPDRFRASVLATYERAWRGGRVPDDESNRVAVILKLSGLMKSDGRQLEVRNRIYREVFNRKWIEDNMPERELMRERQAFRRGLFRAAAASTVILLGVGALALFAWKSGRDAISAKRMLDYELYVSDMNNMRLLEEIGDVARMDEIMDRTKASPYRGFEWNFWLARIHDSREEYTLDYTAPGKREEGYLSSDGKQICIYDTLAGLAAIVDRKSGRPVKVRQIGRKARVVATKSSFVTLTTGSNWVEVSDIDSGRLLNKVGFANRVMGVPATRSGSNFGLVLIRDPKDGNGHDVVLWDMTSGKVKYSYHSESILQMSPLAFSQDGARILFAVNSENVNPAGGQIWTIRNTSTNSEVGHFGVPRRTVLSDMSASGAIIAYTDALHTTACYDVDQRRPVFRRVWDGGDIPISTTVTSNDQAIAEGYGNGRASLVELATHRIRLLGQHVWTLGSVGSSSQLLGNSTSVRILGDSSSGPVTVLASGARFARDDRGGISVFHENPYEIAHFSDPDFKFLRRTSQPKRMRGGFPYNGRWRLTSDETGKVGLFTDADGFEPPIKISPMPVNYSCGTNRDSLVVLERGGHKIKAISESGSIRWTTELAGDPVNGLWVTPSGNAVLALVGDVDLVVLDGKSGHLRANLGGHNIRVSNLTFSRDGRSFFTCGFDGRVIQWSLETMNALQEFRGNATQKMSSADLSPDGSRVATCNYTGSWQLWDARTGVQLMDIHGSPLPLRSILFTADGKAVLTAGDDLMVRKWGARPDDPSVRIPVPLEMLKGIKH